MTPVQDRLLESMLPNSMIRDFKERKLDSLRQTKDKRRAAAFRELDISKATNVRSVKGGREGGRRGRGRRGRGRRGRGRREWKGGESIDVRGRVKQLV